MIVSLLVSLFSTVGQPITVQFVITFPNVQLQSSICLLRLFRYIQIHHVLCRISRYFLTFDIVLHCPFQLGGQIGQIFSNGNVMNVRYQFVFHGPTDFVGRWHEHDRIAVQHPFQTRTDIVARNDQQIFVLELALETEAFLQIQFAIFRRILALYQLGKAQIETRWIRDGILEPKIGQKFQSFSRGISSIHDCIFFARPGVKITNQFHFSIMTTFL
mmetsp:Transcript_23479/g.35651  ORF Transcript_23479/g.35651 Transcript_23479/m.35651 type:complete len:216 (+) Transcript_23479:124-771(+)